MGELARRIYLSKAGLTKMADRLAAAELLERVPSTADRRVVSALLTDSGRRLLARSRELLMAWVEANFRAHLSDEQILNLREALFALFEGHGRLEGQMQHLDGKPHDG